MTIQRLRTPFALLLVTAIAAVGCGGDTGEEAASPDTIAPADTMPINPLLFPGSGDLTQTAPDTFRARFETTAGEFVVEVYREWSPNGADRFYNLVNGGYYDGVRFFRVISGFMAQFGIHAEPAVSAQWRVAMIPDDPVVESNTRGILSFAKSSVPDSRTTQVFINLVNNSGLDEMGFSPFGEVVSGMDVVDQLYNAYGDGPPGGEGPEQGRIIAEGEGYLAESFPELDQVIQATIEAGGA